MARPAYTISDIADSKAALRWLYNKGFTMDIPNNPAPETIQKWCVHNLDKAQWVQLKYAIRMTRTREARKEGKPIVRVDMTQEAHSILAVLSKQYGVSLSQVVMSKLGNTVPRKAKKSNIPASKSKKNIKQNNTPVSKKKVKQSNTLSPKKKVKQSNTQILNNEPKKNTPKVPDIKRKQDGVSYTLPPGTSIVNKDANINGIKYIADYTQEADGQCQAITGKGGRCKEAKGTCNVHVHKGGLYLACRKYHDNAKFKPYIEGDPALLSHEGFTKMVASIPNADKLHKAITSAGYIYFKDEKGNRHKATQKIVRSMAKQVRDKMEG